MPVIDLDSEDDLSPSTRQIASSSKHCLEISSDEGEEGDDLPDAPAVTVKPARALETSHDAAARRSRLLAELQEAANLPAPQNKGKGRVVDRGSSTETETASSSKPPKAKRQRLTEEQKAEREEAKLAAKEAKAQEREAKKKQAEIDKAVKKAETAANKHSGGRSEEILNLRIMFSKPLATATTFQPIYNSVRSQLLEAKIKAVDQFDDDETIIKWQRDCTDSWDAAEAMFKLHPNNEVRVEQEPTILIYVKAKELLSIESLLERVAKARRTHGGSMVQVFVLVEGIKAYKSKEKSQANSAVRQRLDGRPSPTKKNTGPTADDIEMALMRLQLIEKCHILTPNDSNDAIRWLIELTKDIGAHRKRLIEKSHLDRLGISGQTPNMKYHRDDLSTAYIAMLTSMYHIGEGYARSIADKYPTMRKLYEAFERLPAGPERESMLVGIKKGRNNDGSVSTQQMGKDLSRRVHRQLFDEDPDRLMAAMTESTKRKRQEDGQTRLEFGN